MIERKKKTCKTCQTEQYIFSHGRCQKCAAIEREKEKGLKKRIPVRRLKKYSEKYKEILKEYTPKRKAFLEPRPYCEARTKVCTGRSEVIHHMKGKWSKDLYLDERYWMACCSACNLFIETMGEEAYEKGLKIRG